MEHHVIIRSLEEARSEIAHAWLGSSDHAGTASLGSVTLRDHQRDAVERLRTVLERHRVALLADDVGLGKTYVAIAVTAGARAPLVVAPAALRDMWRGALSEAAMQADLISYEQLSRGMPELRNRPDLIILDEAHHARMPSTRRYERLASLAAGSRLLLLSATPIHNRREDLTSLFALAIGSSAKSLDDEAIARRTVRRTHDDLGGVSLPAVVSREWIRLPDDQDLLERLLALPPPLPPSDAGEGGVLLAWTLVRLWASTRGALRAALRRRLQRGWALRQALSAGVLPSRNELLAWQCSDDAIQLAFPELIASPVVDPSKLLVTVQRHLDGVQRLIGALDEGPDPDHARAAAIRTLRRECSGERILLFTQFADSASALWRLLRHEPGVAVLTSKGAEVAGGRITRREALQRFAPAAHNVPLPARAERIDLLISTDLLSEGVNLQDASVVVHLDLPWTHARLAQRVGRVRRMGSVHRGVRVFTFAPPAPAERLLETERRIAGKLGTSARTLGIAGAILPSLTNSTPDDHQSATRAAERLRALIARWKTAEVRRNDCRCAAAIASGGERAALAAMTDGTGQVSLVASTGSITSDDPRVVLAVAKRVDGAQAAPPDERAISSECRRFLRWMEARAAEGAAAGGISIESAARRAALRRLSSILARTPIGRRQETAALVAQARQVASSAIGAGGELVLGQLAIAPMADDAWLRTVAAFAQAHRGSTLEETVKDGATILAIVVLGG